MSEKSARYAKSGVGPSWEALVQIMNRNENLVQVGDFIVVPDPEKAAKAILAEGYHLGHEHNEFGVFHRLGWLNNHMLTPVQNMTFTTRELAEDWIKKSVLGSAAWEVRGHYVTEWK